MSKVSDHLINVDRSIREALSMLNSLSTDAILFVIDDDDKLIGSLTDGDLRRGFLKNLDFENSIKDFIQSHPVYIIRGQYKLEELEAYKAKNFKIIPILDGEHRIVDILNFRLTKTLIPADAVLMAGGEGRRLRPLTQNKPKPMLKVGKKPIIEHNIDRLINFGIKNINISINYLGEQLVDFFGNGNGKGASISYVKEDKPLGTIGSILLVNNFHFEDVLVMNSDLLTDIDFADFYKEFKKSGADMAVAATSYHVDVPYAVLEVDKEHNVKSLKEKPRYTYYSNAGIYFMKREIHNLIPDGEYYDVTDLMDILIKSGKKLITYPIVGYWLDIGKHEDYNKAQEDIHHLNLLN